MGDLSRNFSRSEFACKCGCGFATADSELVQVLEVIRAKFGRPITITSAARCEAHNKAVGGAKSSKHREGIACDIQIANINPFQVYHFLDKYEPDAYGIGCYSTFTHIDVRKAKARWKQ
tara:strand:- start:465 stop:821 length:357 start_codon:yes stop_codon:yes gene_type:complete